MTVLVALLSYGKGSWAQVSNLCKSYDWEDIILIGDEFSKKNFSLDKSFKMVVVNFKQDSEKLRDEIISKIKTEINYPEVALNISSGDGNTHMALISALLKCGVAVRFVRLNNENQIIEV